MTTNQIHRKTYKTEVAIGCVIWLFAMVSYVVIVDLPSGVALLSACIVPVFGYLMFAFGAKVYQNYEASKQDHQQTMKIDAALQTNLGDFKD